MLSAYRVLDLTDQRGNLAGLLLASLGAEVIAIEPPGGSESRRQAPFFADQAGIERSLIHWSYNRGKKSVVLDFNDAADRERFLTWVRSADVLIETFRPGYLRSIGLDASVLAECNPALVHTSMTPFGSDGPKANWAATDLTLMAAAGVSTLAGDADRAPVRISLAQAWLHASAEAASATLIALHERARSGLGQHVDVSAQQAAMLAAQAQPLAFPNRANPPVRAGGGAKVGPLNLRFVYPARDGHVIVSIMFGTMVGPYMRRLFEWICEEGLCDEATRDKDWIEYGMLLLTGKEPISEYNRIIETIARFTATKTKAELFEAASARRLLIAPAANARDVLENPHLAARDVWESVEWESGEPARRRSILRVPSRIAKFSGAPQPQLGRPPRLGEHTAEVLSQPRSTAESRGDLRAATSAPALGDLKILDFAWVMAGPLATRVLADHGATVVRIESATRQDLIRALQPRIDGNPSPEHSAPQQNFNAGKLGLTLNPNTPAGREVVLDLVRWADVVFDSFAPGAMAAWGFDYESLRKINPKIVQVSSSLMGQSGPLAKFAGFGNLGAALSGFYEVTGWPDREPVGPFAAYTDSVAPRFAVLSILAALEHRRRTGEGQFVDLSQAESALHFYTPALLDLQVNNRVMRRMGNADPYCAPHGTYPVAGADRWIAIACETDEHWQTLCVEMDRPDLARDASLATAAGRLARSAELDEIVGKWTAPLDGERLEAKLQARGVPTHRLQTSEDLFNDPQLAHRHHFVTVPHPLISGVVIEGTRFQLSRTPARIDRGGPTLGQHVHEVLSGILGYNDDRIAKIVASGALE
jgi:crotonobetainyl-CoA:carnitine CoA-transferase CaiB-like acyl-CoA transferase